MPLLMAQDILDQNLWEVKLLKLLARRVSAEERQLLPALLNVFYYRETLFIVYELLRDNLYHIYKCAEGGSRKHTRPSSMRAKVSVRTRDALRLQNPACSISHGRYIEECHLPRYFTTDRLREVSRQCLQTLAVLVRPRSIRTVANATAMLPEPVLHPGLHSNVGSTHAR